MDELIAQIEISKTDRKLAALIIFGDDTEKEFVSSSFENLITEIMNSLEERVH